MTSLVWLALFGRGLLYDTKHRVPDGIAMRGGIANEPLIEGEKRAVFAEGEGKIGSNWIVVSIRSSSQPSLDLCRGDACVAPTTSW